MTQILLVLLLMCVVTGRGTNERVGDSLQVTLPMAALVCTVARGRGPEYLGRFVLLTFGIQTPKHLLGSHNINRRPNGGLKGMPSGHTAAAAFGATGLLQTCLNSSRVGQVAAVLSAGYVAGSRIEAEKHTLWQSVAGGLWGILAQTLTWSGLTRTWRGLRRRRALT
jgi:membrane-associated phospholipid phosphatase